MRWPWNQRNEAPPNAADQVMLGVWLLALLVVIGLLISNYGWWPLAALSPPKPLSTSQTTRGGR